LEPRDVPTVEFAGAMNLSLPLTVVPTHISPGTGVPSF